MKTLFYEIRYFILKIIIRIRFNNAKKKADWRKEVNNGKKHIVLVGKRGHFIVTSRKEFLYKRRKGYFNKKFTWERALEEACYTN